MRALAIKRKKPIVVTLRANAIREILRRRNMSQAAFAEAIGVRACYISFLLSGTRNPRAALRTRIAVALGITKWRQLFREKKK